MNHNNQINQINQKNTVTQPTYFNTTNKPKEREKFIELFFLVVASILMTGLLSGCNTTQTLAAQFGMAPLPTKVARKLYGTCGECDLNPNCPLCKAVQNYNRKVAGAPKSQRSKYPLVGTSYRNHANDIKSNNPYGYNYPKYQNPQGQGYGSYQGYQTQAGNQNQNKYNRYYNRYNQAPSYPNYPSYSQNQNYQQLGFE